jgi:hypothetical protein
MAGCLFDDAKLGGAAKNGFSTSAPFCVPILVPSKYRIQSELNEPVVSKIQTN